MKQSLTKVLLAAAGLLLSASGIQAQTAPANIALHRSVTYNTKPNYSYSTDPEDAIQLTDGKYSSGADAQEVEKTRAIWVQKGTVGWQNRNPVVITIDLGSVQPISGVSFSSAGGTSGVFWPTSIHMAVSDDNATWHYMGNLVQLSRKNGAPPAKGYAAFRYIDRDLHTKGRYITFGVESVPFVFCDEIEVYRGDDALLNKPASGKVIPPMTTFVPQMVITSAVQRRINDDIAAIQQSINTSALSPDRKSTFINRLNKDAAATLQLDALPRDFKTLLPLNDIHRDVLAVRGQFLAEQGFKLVTLWKQHRYQWLPLLAKPDLQEKPALNFSMLKNQFRSDNLLFTNASDRTQTITLQLQDPPQNTKSGWLHIDSVAWTDTAQGIPVADALFPVAPQNGIYTFDIPAGMTRKIWFTIDSSKLASGISKSTFRIRSNEREFTVPLNLDISQTAMHKPRLSLGMWDYSNLSSYAIKDNNRLAAIALMRSHFVNTAWGSRNVLPWPPTSDFDAQGKLKTKLDFTALDHWISLWPGNKNFFVYANMKASFAGSKMGTPEFNIKVGNWAKVLSAHLKERGMQPQQLGILLVDEPHTDAQDATIAAWAKAIKTAAPEITIFEDPAWPRPDKTKTQEAITWSDILCPNVYIFKAGGVPVKKYFQQLQAQGKQQWFYQCSGPVRLYDPQLYYRYQAWHAFENGATGEGFWSFSDTSKAPSSFSEYGTSRINYAPAFFDNDKVYNSIHWDAVREGVEDYEELAMLQNAINSSNNAAWREHAQRTLDEALKAVTGVWSRVYAWSQKSNPELADAQLRKMRDTLSSER